MDKLLPIPQRQPSYRQNRSHENFLTNLNVPPRLIKEGLTQAWNAEEEMKDVPLDRIERLVKERYAKEEWNAKF